METNLICYSQCIGLVIDSEAQVDAVYTDFSKAFDKISHKHLDGILDEAGINSNGYLRDPFIVTSGASQGSHLGLLSFIIYINNINQAVKICNLLLYADNLNITNMSDYGKISAWRYRYH